MIPFDQLEEPLKRPRRDVGCQRDWLDALPAQSETQFVRWVHLEKPVRVYIDSLRGRGVCLKPSETVQEVMDEEDASGI